MSDVSASNLKSSVTHVLAAAIQIPVMNEIMQEMKMVPLLPVHLFSGAFDQHPRSALQS
jgi:hypothetical protein